MVTQSKIEIAWRAEERRRKWKRENKWFLSKNKISFKVNILKRWKYPIY